VSDLEKRAGTLACPRCKAPMKEVVRIAPVQSDPGLIAYECPSCGYVTSVLISPKDGEAGSGAPTMSWMPGQMSARIKRICVMPHLARIFFIAFASVAASCSAERAQKESERKEIGRQLTAAYYSCVRTSFASMLPTMVDRNMGIDQALKVCRSEEAKLQAFEESIPGTPTVSAGAMAAHRDRLKEELLRR
jgi:hypothetical protein